MLCQFRYSYKYGPVLVQLDTHTRISFLQVPSNEWTAARKISRQ